MAHQLNVVSQSSLEDALSNLSIKTDASNGAKLRRLAASHLMGNPQDFLPFLVDDNGNMLDDNQFAEYCRNVRDTATWGGQVEIQALSAALKCPIHIVQANMPLLAVGQDQSGQPLWVSQVYYSCL